MEAFTYRGGCLMCEGVSVADLAGEVGTPCYVYSRRAIESRYGRLAEAFAPANPLICYAVKANGSLAILRLLADLGAGFDIVSGGELFLARTACGDGARVVYAGVGKTEAEIRQALQAGILMFNVESEDELALIDRVAGEMGETAPVALRLNPDVDPRTMEYIATGHKDSKFGIDFATARRIVEGVGERPHVRLIGYHGHVGSQVTDLGPHAEALERIIAFAADCQPPTGPIEYINIGGGFGIDYRPGQAPPPQAFAELLLPQLEASGLEVRLILEPGRYIVGNAGILVTRAVRLKRTPARRFVVVDAAMNDLLRPSLYKAHHGIWPVRSDAPFEEDGFEPADVVGPVCESGDFLGKERRLPPVAAGDLLAVFSAGAYGYAMSSNYNARPRPPEVLVDGDTYREIRRRETYEDLILQEAQDA
ncbi:MAG: diaminopimelate decarboxylase [Planctomycetota bacterium]